ncbi:hypothetical protein GF376_01520 [Candidatus Peregrinibacteria bacterium]|nr:hypothetical protein [Candidatus Peregrinibacteria bacterium]
MNEKIVNIKDYKNSSRIIRRNETMNVSLPEELENLTGFSEGQLELEQIRKRVKCLACESVCNEKIGRLISVSNVYANIPYTLSELPENIRSILKSVQAVVHGCLECRVFFLYKDKEEKLIKEFIFDSKNQEVVPFPSHPSNL